MTWVFARSIRELSFLILSDKVSCEIFLYGRGGGRFVSAPGRGCTLCFLSLRTGSCGGGTSDEMATLSWTRLIICIWMLMPPLRLSWSYRVPRSFILFFCSVER